MNAFVIIEDVDDCSQHIVASYFVHRIIFVGQVESLVAKVMPVEEVEELYEALEKEDVVLLEHIQVQMDKQPLVEGVVIAIVLT